MENPVPKPALTTKPKLVVPQLVPAIKQNHAAARDIQKVPNRFPLLIKSKLEKRDFKAVLRTAFFYNIPYSSSRLSILYVALESGNSPL